MASYEMTREVGETLATPYSGLAAPARSIYRAARPTAFSTHRFIQAKFRVHATRERRPCRERSSSPSAAPKPGGSACWHRTHRAWAISVWFDHELSGGQRWWGCGRRRPGRQPAPGVVGRRRPLWRVWRHRRVLRAPPDGSSQCEEAVDRRHRRDLHLVLHDAVTRRPRPSWNPTLTGVVRHAEASGACGRSGRARVA